MPTWTVLVVVEGKIKPLGDYTGISEPGVKEIFKMALENDAVNFSDYAIIMTDDGRES